jgi:hypothetical protein
MRKFTVKAAGRSTFEILDPFGFTFATCRCSRRFAEKLAVSLSAAYVLGWNDSIEHSGGALIPDSDDIMSDYLAVD